MKSTIISWAGSFGDVDLIFMVASEESPYKDTCISDHKTNNLHPQMTILCIELSSKQYDRPKQTYTALYT